MTRTNQAAGKVIATYSDSWFERTYRKFAGVLPWSTSRVRDRFGRAVPIPLVPEASADAPPWRGRADGALVDGATAGDVDAFATWLRRGEVPTVAMVSNLTECGIPTVGMDGREIGRAAARHLASDCGCRSFLHVRQRRKISSSRGKEAFCDALAALGHEAHSCEVDYVALTEDPRVKPLEDPRLETLLLTLPRPIGLFATLDAIAAAAIAACRRLGLRVPQDVAVLGVDNTLLAHTHCPSISSIRIQEHAIGATAMRLLAELMRGATPPPEPVLIGGCEIYARTSTVGTEERGGVLTVDVAMERIQAAACSGLTVNGLAQSLGVSRRTLVNAFQRERGVTPSEEIQRVRFEKAALLLRFTKHSVIRTAELTGFSDAPHFCRFFHRMIGMTPLEYRAGSDEAAK